MGEGEGDPISLFHHDFLLGQTFHLQTRVPTRRIFINYRSFFQDNLKKAINNDAQHMLCEQSPVETFVSKNNLDNDFYQIREEFSAQAPTPTPVIATETICSYLLSFLLQRILHMHTVQQVGKHHTTDPADTAKHGFDTFVPKLSIQ